MSKVNHLVKYVRDNKNHRVGVVIALNRDQIGWSRCNKKDTFSKEWGKELAIIRATNEQDRPMRVPQSMVVAMAEMTDRARRYYKEDYQADTREADHREEYYENASRLR